MDFGLARAAERTGLSHVPLRIIVAEDEWIVAAAMRMQVESEGHEVVGTATTGTKALDLIRSEHPDLVLMDVQMPELNGLDATRQAMTSCPTSIVIVTGAGGLAEDSERAGAMAHAVKPVLRSQLPVLIADAQQRFEQYSAVLRESAGPEEALREWPTVRAAVRRLVETEGISEEQAFARLRERASAHHLRLTEAAARLVVTN